MSMNEKTIATVIDVVKLVVVAVEGLRDALDKGLPALKDALSKAEAVQEQLAADRKEADDALDRKFDK